MKNDPELRTFDELRKDAEARLDYSIPGVTARPAEELLHELMVHQIELEMQNETLRQAQIELEKSHDRYMDIYDFAPVGYLTLTPDAIIAEINLTGASLLGMERRELLERRFEKFVAPEDRDRWHRHFIESLKKNSLHRCELLLRKDGSSFHAGIDCLRVACNDGKHSLRLTIFDITEIKQAEARLKEHQQLLRELVSQSIALREAEARHIAREVHDELGQILTALRMDLSLLRIQYGSHDAALMKKIMDMLAKVDQAIKGVRNVALNLRPAVLDMGIIPAIGWLCDNFPGRSNTACSLRVEDVPAALDNAQVAAIFRIVQESLTNVTRHAEANSVRITLGQRGDDVFVEVCDDGKGFDIDAMPANRSFGIMGMSERALALGGKVEISSVPSKGTVVSMRIPVRRDLHANDETCNLGISYPEFHPRMEEARESLRRINIIRNVL